MAVIGTIEIPGQYTVQLTVNEAATHWYVSYGMQPVIVKRTAAEAIEEFKNCGKHAMACAGWLD
jgi:hypothetical protein